MILYYCPTSSRKKRCLSIFSTSVFTALFVRHTVQDPYIFLAQQAQAVVPLFALGFPR